MTQSCWELFDTESGNVIEDFATGWGALDALIDVVGRHGAAAIATFALTRVDSGRPTLIAMQDELLRRVEREMREHALERRRS